MPGPSSGGRALPLAIAGMCVGGHRAARAQHGRRERPGSASPTPPAGAVTPASRGSTCHPHRQQARPLGPVAERHGAPCEPASGGRCAVPLPAVRVRWGRLRGVLGSRTRPCRGGDFCGPIAEFQRRAAGDHPMAPHRRAGLGSAWCRERTGRSQGLRAWRTRNRHAEWRAKAENCPSTDLRPGVGRPDTEHKAGPRSPRSDASADAARGEFPHHLVRPSGDANRLPVGCLGPVPDRTGSAVRRPIPKTIPDPHGARPSPRTRVGSDARAGETRLALQPPLRGRSAGALDASVVGSLRVGRGQCGWRTAPSSRSRGSRAST